MISLEKLPAFHKFVSSDSTTGERTKKLEPLFPGSLFVNLEQTGPTWAKLQSTRGVIRVVSFANKPAAISDNVTQHIKDSLHIVAEQGGTKPGRAVELDEGPFKGLCAIFQAYDGEECASSSSVPSKNNKP